MDVADHWHGLAYNNLVCEVVELLITCCRRGRGTPTDNTSYRHQDYTTGSDERKIARNWKMGFVKCQSSRKRTVDTTDSIVKLRNTRDQETPNAFDDGELLPAKYIRKLKEKRNKKKMTHKHLCTPFFDLQQGITTIAMTRRQFSSRDT